MRPFGISTFIVGFEHNEPKLYLTEPSGAYSLWRANAIGRNSKTLREYLEKNHRDDLNVDESIKLAVETLMEVVESPKNIEICVSYLNKKHEMLEEEAVGRVVAQIEKEREDAEQKK